MELKENYQTPRWTQEIPDCSMPMTFDTYSKCAYNCQYCFSYFQKSHSLDGYIGGAVRCANRDKVKALFDKALADDREHATKSELQFFPYIQARRIMQWGGLADEFDEYERRFGITLDLLKDFDELDYPLSFSTKATWWTQDDRYMALFKKHTHNWHVKISIICMDKEKAAKVEKGVPTPRQRLDAIKRLSSIGVHVTLRLRPFIIGISNDWKELMEEAKKAGADSVTTEFFCMEARATDDLKARYAEMSRIAGYDIHKFYMQNSKQMGYKRLNRSIKAPIIHEMRDYAHGMGLRFHVSDAFCRECNDAMNCCGVPPEWNIDSKGHIGKAILIAKEKGEVHYSDIKPDIDRFFSGFRWNDALGYNSGSNRRRAQNAYASMADFIRNNWNNVKGGDSPAGMYGGILKPIGRDEAGDVVYKYTGRG